MHIISLNRQAKLHDFCAHAQFVPGPLALTVFWAFFLAQFGVPRILKLFSGIILKCHQRGTGKDKCFKMQNHSSDRGPHGFKPQGSLMLKNHRVD